MKKIIVTLVFCMTTMIVFAPPLPGGRPDGPAAEVEPEAPITTATTLLLVLGVGYSVYATVKKKKN
ncbi:MAG: hypothetical protein LBR17_09105 [Bacteroidales bacterium]|jgi:hypothetical protein|nr:hypothetical protein [Bacteroidales bacterium]